MTNRLCLSLSLSLSLSFALYFSPAPSQRIVSLCRCNRNEGRISPEKKSQNETTRGTDRSYDDPTFSNRRNGVWDLLGKGKGRWGERDGRSRALEKVGWRKERVMRRRVENRGTETVMQENEFGNERVRE
jgi:hypothetical protein